MKKIVLLIAFVFMFCVNVNAQFFQTSEHNPSLSLVSPTNTSSTNYNLRVDVKSDSYLSMGTVIVPGMPVYNDLNIDYYDGCNCVLNGYITLRNGYNHISVSVRNAYNGYASKMFTICVGCAPMDDDNSSYSSNYQNNNGSSASSNSSKSSYDPALAQAKKEHELAKVKSCQTMENSYMHYNSRLITMKTHPNEYDDSERRKIQSEMKRLREQVMDKCGKFHCPTTMENWRP